MVRKALADIARNLVDEDLYKSLRLLLSSKDVCLCDVPHDIWLDSPIIFRVFDNISLLVFVWLIFLNLLNQAEHVD